MEIDDARHAGGQNASLDELGACDLDQNTVRTASQAAGRAPNLAFDFAHGAKSPLGAGGGDLDTLQVDVKRLARGARRWCGSRTERFDDRQVALRTLLEHDVGLLDADAR